MLWFSLRNVLIGFRTKMVTTLNGIAGGIVEKRKEYKVRYSTLTVGLLHLQLIELKDYERLLCSSTCRVTNVS